MTSEFTLPLIRRRQLDDLGWGSRRVRREVEQGHLAVVRHGVYARAEDMAHLTRAEQKVVVGARALALISRRRPTFCGITAAAIHGLPCLRDDGRLHVLSTDERPGAPADVVRHRDLDDRSFEEVNGLWCTPLARTVADVARNEMRDVSLSVADAALRRHAFEPPGAYDAEAASRLREEALAWAGLARRNRRTAERILHLADGRAQLPGESVSRMRLLDLGFAAPSLQVPVAAPHGGTYWVDFGLDDVGAWGEFDGKAKYNELAEAAGRSAFEVVDREKRREDWIRGTTNRRFARWGWDDLRDAATLGRRLHAFGITPPR
ncbi:type IV toxin-antitoxin system AbiEi family antitoxin domain-containing protein [Microbacterium sp. lyk4-40-TSB-66]|uniref:type IV toxin-antitoxin system AbiEi family antitoxin domain-containing protein n=1 Tax=Microbacterium sp. lyk4-40-TSB-66 TaxID=3040294 RepID=UPI00254F4106|nr:type IV toxin-antitoxin system AbiEi family antitoxin domain-containing protein [Microbacterium sp. lyk4-40-TSB-66]